VAHAISVEIHAAIVGGLISGAVVLLGVLLAEGLRRGWERRQALRRAIRVIVQQLPIAMIFLTENTPDERRWNIESPGWIIYQQVMSACTEADTASRSRWTRHRAEVRAALDEIVARMSAAAIRSASGHLVTVAQLSSIPTDQLTLAVFGKRNTIDDRLIGYVKRGLPVAEESKPQEE
jgi:hypothetical protein